MRVEILNRPGHPIEVCYGGQIVGAIQNGPNFGWYFHPYVSSWDYFNPARVQELLAMVDDKIKILNITQRLMK